MDGDRVEHALDRYARIRVGRESLLTEGLLDLECGPVRAPVLVNRHRYTDYKSPVVAPTEWQRGGGAAAPSILTGSADQFAEAAAGAGSAWTDSCEAPFEL